MWRWRPFVAGFVRIRAFRLWRFAPTFHKFSYDGNEDTTSKLTLRISTCEAKLYRYEDARRMDIPTSLMVY